MAAPVVNLSDGDELERAGHELLASLARRPRELPSRYGYDELGSALFERITTLPDISADALRDSCERYATYHPELRVRGAIGEFLAGLRWAAAHCAGRRLAVMLGGTIGNLAPASRTELWRALKDAMAPSDGFLVGADLVKDPAIVAAAYRCRYDGPLGVRTRFALNRLSHLNDLFGGDFDEAGFEADSIYDARRRRVEGRLTSTRNQVVTLSRVGARLQIDAGEVILRDVMQKLTVDELAAEAAAQGLRLTDAWTDEAGWYAVVMFGLADRDAGRA
jgi:L-histidine Nalpha-methyltransferase